ncbi:MAG: efflux RND transporter periplasmic adaptor subunit [Pirellulaceae bacterium]|nr:efflux RND transporter periplasmic adaptor subunit [Pirellulaceae bacterium]
MVIDCFCHHTRNAGWRMRVVFVGFSLYAMLNPYIVDAATPGDAEIVVNPVLIKVIEEVAVPAVQEGPILNIQVKEGQVVQVGQALMQLDDQRARLKQQQASLEQKIAATKAGNRAAVLTAETEVRVTNSSLQRALESRKRFPDTPSQAEVDEIELRVAQGKQHLEQATQEFQLAELAKELSGKNLELATLEVERHQIKSPIQGAVTEIIAKKGEWVRPGEPLVRVTRIDRLKVEGFLKRESVSPALLDRSVTIAVEGDEDDKVRHVGKIVYISPVVEPNDRTQRIVAEVDNSRGLLGPGLRAKMIIQAR